MTDKTMTLGARLLAAKADELEHPVEAARKKAEREGKGKYFAAAVEFFKRFKKDVELCADEGRMPKWVEFTSEEDAAFEGYTWYRLKPPAGEPPMSRTHYTYPLWMEFLEWAKEQGLQVKWRGCHDGGGERSWGEVMVVPIPAPLDFRA